MDQMDAWVNSIIQLTSTGGMGALLWYVIMYVYPAMEERHRAERTEWQATLQSIQAAQQSRDDQWLVAIRELESSLRGSEQAIRAIGDRLRKD